MAFQTGIFNYFLTDRSSLIIEIKFTLMSTESTQFNRLQKGYSLSPNYPLRHINNNDSWSLMTHFVYSLISNATTAFERKGNKTIQKNTVKKLRV